MREKGVKRCCVSWSMQVEFFFKKMAFDHTHEISELFTYLHDCKPLEHLSNETLSDSHSRLRCRAVQ